MRHKSLRLTFPPGEGGNHISGTVQLTGSKSESNRALIMQALSNGKVKIENLSKAVDTVTLSNILTEELGTKSKEQGSGNQEQGAKSRDQRSNTGGAILNTQYSILIDVGPAGTAMRFLTAYAAMQTGQIILTGSQRMKERPLGILVDALWKLGAEIEYTEKEGFPPLAINGPLKQKTSKISIKGNVSSQYISSLLLIAPVLPQGLEIHIESDLTSRPYVEMTLAMLSQAGINHEWKENIITVAHQSFNTSTIIIEPDWSAASYWYAIAALADDAELYLPGLTAYSLQGDSRITEIMANFGITTQFKNGGAYLKKEPKKLERKIFDFKECPDLAQTVIVCCAALGHNATFTGLETLKIKETDRIRALQNEMEKIGVKLIEKNLTYKLDCSGLNLSTKPLINTYHDHRMAMAFAPLALRVNEIEIEYPQVVEKSYPHFWEDLQKVGFKTDMVYETDHD